MIHCSLFGLNCKSFVIFTKFLLTDRNWFFFLLAPAFTFSPSKNSNLKFILSLHNERHCSSNSIHTLGSQQWIYWEPLGLVSYRVQRVTRETWSCYWIYSCLSVCTQLKQTERKDGGWGTISEPSGSPLPPTLWDWPCDMLWPVGQLKTWYQQKLKKCMYTGACFLFCCSWELCDHCFVNKLGLASCDRRYMAKSHPLPNWTCANYQTLTEAILHHPSPAKPPADLRDLMSQSSPEPPSQCTKSREE